MAAVVKPRLLCFRPGTDTPQSEVGDFLTALIRRRKTAIVSKSGVRKERQSPLPEKHDCRAVVKSSHREPVASAPGTETVAVQERPSNLGCEGEFDSGVVGRDDAVGRHGLFTSIVG